MTHHEHRPPKRPRERLAHFGVGYLYVLFVFSLRLAGTVEAADLPQVIEPATKAYVITAQQSVVLKFAEDVSSIAVADPEICSITKDANDPKRFMLVGGKHGDTHVTFWFVRPDQDPMTLPVQVRLSATQLTQLEDFLNAHYQNAALKLESVPLTGKIVVSGSLPSRRAVAEVTDAVSGALVAEQGLVNRITTDPDLAQLATFLNQEFPQSKISLTKIPVSEKILVEGRVSTRSQADAVVQMIAGDNIPADHIVNRLNVCCCNCFTRCRLLRP